jgi:hypothetical protein
MWPDSITQYQAKAHPSLRYIPLSVLACADAHSQCARTAMLFGLPFGHQSAMLVLIWTYPHSQLLCCSQQVRCPGVNYLLTAIPRPRRNLPGSDLPHAVEHPVQQHIVCALHNRLHGYWSHFVLCCTNSQCDADLG